mgnify:FL=1
MHTYSVSFIDDWIATSFIVRESLFSIRYLNPHHFIMTIALVVNAVALLVVDVGRKRVDTSFITIAIVSIDD